MSASHASVHHPATAADEHHDAPDIGSILDRGRIVTGHKTSSKKKLLEQIAGIFSESITGADAGRIFSTLIERENLGSTGIGQGVALPHGRISGLSDVVGVYIQLKDDLDFDAADHQPVNLIFAILVPENATEEHLNLLASLAGIFRNDEKRKKLLSTTDPSQIREIFSLATHEGKRF